MNQVGGQKEEGKGGCMTAEGAMNDILSFFQLKKNASQTKFSGVPTPEGPQGQVGKGYMD